MLVVLAITLAILGYIYVGYPVLLRLAVSLRGVRHVRQADITPPLSLVISAYNEAAVIRRKLDNALALLYPRDALEIVVVSDASNDGTDDIVAEYADRGVRLARQAERRGKTAGLNRTVPALAGDIVVFSDANAIYERDALLKLARNFADPEVGCVTGEARYLAGGRGAADVGERVYWDYEIQIKRLETALGSMVGGDGAIYAIRRPLWRQLPDNAINDFLNPLQIVEAGWRGVYEPDAVCYEETAGGIRTEYRRRVRIVSRSWRAVFQAAGVLNPLRVGLFTWSLVSHKLLRWLSGTFIALATVATVMLAIDLAARRPGVVLGALAILTAGLTVSIRGRQIALMAIYFATIYAASMVGVIKGSVGQVSGVWTTPRLAESAGGARPGVLVPVGLLMHVVLALLIGATFLIARTVSTAELAAMIFWASASVLAYVYVGYPSLLAVIRLIAGRQVDRADIEPSVCVFITANDEAEIIEAKLRNTLALDYPADRLAVVLASDGSVDGTNELARRFEPRVRVLEFFPRRGKIAAINEGIHQVTADIVVFSDANTMLEPDAVRALVRNFADPQVGAVSGDVVLFGERAALGPSEDLYYRYERWVQRAESEVGSMIGADGALYAIRRELFTPPQEDTILDDMAIPMGVVKAGRRVVFDGAARAFEQGSESAREEFARKSRVIAGAMQFMRRRDSAIPATAPQVILSLVSHKALRWLSPAFGAGALFSSIVLAPSSLVYTAVLCIESAILVLGFAGCFPRLRAFGPVAIAHYFCLLQAAAAVGFIRGLAGRQSVLWRRFARGHSPAPVGIGHE
jgi:cellulose synthase/poly-beta-1,6-N-acetylglucosamine synthase-like glycosyltransferase